jgi:hypothetical protein
VAVTLLSSTSTAGHGTAGARVRAEGQASGLTGPLRAIRSAILANDADRLVRCFEPNQPIFVHMTPFDRGGFLGPGPLDSFVRRLLAERVSVSFDVADVPDVPADSSRVFVKAEWTYRPSGSSTLQVDHLHLVLSHAPEHAEWLIVEMKASTR